MCFKVSLSIKCLTLNTYLILDPILIAKAIQDYYPQDCRFIPIHQGQIVYVYAMLKGRGNLFWSGSVSIYDWFRDWLCGFQSSLLLILCEKIMCKTIYTFVYQVQGSYYGEQEARLGHFPSSVVEETHALMPAEVEVKTNVSNALFFVLTLRFYWEIKYF